MGKCEVCGKKLGFFEGYSDSRGEFCKKCFNSPTKIKRMTKKKNENASELLEEGDFSGENKSNGKIDKNLNLPVGVDKVVDSLVKQLEKQLDTNGADGLSRNFKIQIGNSSTNKKSKKNNASKKLPENTEAHNKEKITITGVSKISKKSPIKSITISPTRINTDFNFFEEAIENIILGEKVSIGCEIHYSNYPTMADFSGFDNSKFFGGIRTQIDFTVLKIEPTEGGVITDNTLIKFRDKIPSGEDIPNEKIIEVLSFPNLKNYNQVKTIMEIIKLANAGAFVNKFEDKNNTIYFADRYFYKVTGNNGKRN